MEIYIPAIFTFLPFTFKSPSWSKNTLFTFLLFYLLQSPLLDCDGYFLIPFPSLLHLLYQAKGPKL